MLLAIDIGNSATRIGLFKDRELIMGQRIPNTEVGDIKSWLPKEEVKAVTIASVVPGKDDVFSRVIQGVYGVTPKFIDSSLIKGTYPELGADRVANLIGGGELFGLPVCVIDFGTATTVDVLLKNNTYGGGIILPGVKLGLQSLHQNTSLLPKIYIVGANCKFQCDERALPPLLGKSTYECIELGAYWGEVYRIQGFVKKIEESINPGFVCTGGIGELFAQELALKYEPWLSLWGLYFGTSGNYCKF